MYYWEDMGRCQRWEGDTRGKKDEWKDMMKGRKRKENSKTCWEDVKMAGRD